MNRIGIMQGRLSPRSSARVQSFPWRTWEAEFHQARLCGFDSIEWLFEAEAFEQNPIWNAAGREKIANMISTGGMEVRSLCANYFMTHPFFRVSEEDRKRSVAVLNELVPRAASIGVSTILLPVLEESELRTDQEQGVLAESLRESLDLAAEFGIQIGLETELPALDYRAVIERQNHSALAAYYDTGNAAAKGYDAADDIHTLHGLLCGVHIKDRKRGGPNVPLGQGDVDFAKVFSAIDEVAYLGPLILETTVGDDPIAFADAHLRFVSEGLERLLGNSVSVAHYDAQPIR